MNPASPQGNSFPSNPSNGNPTFNNVDDIVKEYNRIAQESMYKADHYQNELLKMHHDYDELMEAAQTTSDLLMQSCEVIKKLRKEKGNESKRTTASEVATKIVAAVSAIFFFFLDLLWDVFQFIAETTSRTWVWMKSERYPHNLA